MASGGKRSNAGRPIQGEERLDVKIVVRVGGNALRALDARRLPGESRASVARRAIMAWLSTLTLLALVGCGGRGVPMGPRLIDGEACVADEECCGTSPVDAPGVRILDVRGTCYVGKCATEYRSEGWDCVIVDDSATCWQIN